VTPPAGLARLVKTEPGEGIPLAWATSGFFFLLAGYYVIRPLRDELGVSAGGDALNWLFLGTLAGTFLVNPLFGALTSRVPRRVFVPLVYHVLAASFVAFLFPLTFLSGPARTAVARFFFVYASVFNLLTVSLYWGFLADLFRPGPAKRLFGFVGLGGTLGGVLGGSLTASLARPLGIPGLLLLSAGLLEISVVCSRRLLRIFRVDEARPPAAGGPSEAASDGAPPGSGALSGMRLFLRSGYLLAIAVFLVLFTIGSTFLYFEQARIVRASFHDSASRTAFFARMDLGVNILAAITQAFFTGRLLPALGLGPALLLMPAVTGGAFLALSSSPTPAVLAAVQVFRRAAEFALVKPAREVLFTVIPREQKYASKSFIDTFVYRSGDAIGALLDKAFVVLGVSPQGFALAFLPVAGLWAWNALSLARRQRALAGEAVPAALRTGT
jgi:AAA family ATP:ADP antiporter